VIIDIVGLISTIFITLKELLPLFFVPTFVFYSFSAFCGFEILYDFIFSPFLAYQFYFFFSFLGLP